MGGYVIQTTMTTNPATTMANFCYSICHSINMEKIACKPSERWPNIKVLLHILCSLGAPELKQTDDEFKGGAPWFSGIKHNNTCKPHSCGTLFLQGLSLSLSYTPRHPLSLPFQPPHPFLEALPHTTLGRVGGITWGVHLCMCVWTLYLCVCMWAKGKARERSCWSETSLFKCAI